MSGSVKHGHLMLQIVGGSKSHNKWKGPLFALLDHQFIQLYKIDAVAKKSLNVQGATLRMDVQNRRHNHCFAVLFPEEANIGELNLSADSAEVKSAWLDALNDVIDGNATPHQQQQQQQQDTDMFMEGFLEKKAIVGKFRHNWKRRFMQLSQDGVLSYYDFSWEHAVPVTQVKVSSCGSHISNLSK